MSLSMLRSIEYADRWLQWAKSKDAEKNRNVPEPERFPWEPNPKSLYEADAMTWDEAADWLGWSLEMNDHMRGGA